MGGGTRRARQGAPRRARPTSRRSTGRTSDEDADGFTTARACDASRPARKALPPRGRRGGPVFSTVVRDATPSERSRSRVDGKRLERRFRGRQFRDPEILTGLQPHPEVGGVPERHVLHPADEGCGRRILGGRNETVSPTRTSATAALPRILAWSTGYAALLRGRHCPLWVQAGSRSPVTSSMSWERAAWARGGQRMSSAGNLGRASQGRPAPNNSILFTVRPGYGTLCGGRLPRP